MQLHVKYEVALRLGVYRELCHRRYKNDILHNKSNHCLSAKR